MMIETENIEFLIIDYIEGNASKSQTEQLLRWIRESDDNRAAFFEIKNMYDRKNNVVTLSDEELICGWDKIASEISVNRRSSFRRISLQICRYAAVILVAAGVGFGLNHYLDMKAEPTYNEISIDAGCKSTIFLSDGTKVVLNASSKFRYPTSFNSSAREVFLEGEAFFDVKSDKKHPFIVKSQQQSIRVLGTSFNIQAYRGDTVNTVTLLSGSIMMDVFDKRGNQLNSLTMKPYERCSFNTKKGLLYVTTIDDVDKYRSWTDGIFRFRDEKLEVIAARLEKYYGIRIDIGDSSIRKTHYTGSFSLDQNIKEVLEILNYESKFTIKTQGKNFVLENKASI